MIDSKTTVPSTTNVASSARSWLIFAAVGTFATIIFGILYLFVLAPSIPDGSIGWFLFSFATGLTMIVMPCTLPLAFVIVPLSMGKGLVRGIGMALAFGLGIAVTLSMYGVAAALLGGVAIDALGADIESIKNWVYTIAGAFALVFALSEIGLMNFHMPTYKGAAPASIQKHGELIKAFMLGLFLGNVGVGCPHPATPLILIEIASSGDVLYGWLLFLTHAIGRILPLLLLAFLAILGVNGLNWLMARKDAVERTTGWAMVFVAGFILTLGLFSHDWWVNSGLHSGLETLTQEHRFNVLINDTLGTSVEHVHGLEEGTGLFGLPLEWGSLFLVFLWIFPMYWWYKKKKKAIEEGGDLCDEKVLAVKRNFLILTAIFLIIIFAYYMPKNFYLKSVGGVGHDDSSAAAEHSHGAVDGHMMDGHDMGMMEGTPFLTTTEDLPYATESKFVELNDGDSYDLSAGYVQKEVGNRTLRMLAYNGSVPGPFIKAPQGAEVTINFTNNTDIDQTIHSHGIRLDNNFDGVPAVTQDAVAPGKSFSYSIKFADAGVYWYHPHTRDDYGQEMGLYGNYLIDPENGYSSSVNREVPLVIDDILIKNDKIVDFYKEYTNFALLGRFGNEYLVNGETNYRLPVETGEVIRFFVTDVANARTFNLSIPGAEMKLIGADVGHYEHEFFADAFLISPAERMIVEVYFENAGTYELRHTMPDGEVALMHFDVTGEGVAKSNVESFQVAHVDDVVTEEFSSFRKYLEAEPDKRMLLTVKLMGEVDHSTHASHDATDEPEHDMDSMSAMEHSMMDTEITPGIQWDDPTMSDAMNMNHNVQWMLVDEDTGKVSMEIDDWTFEQGDLVKVRITNDDTADHVMQHPVHLHGQRFVVLSENGVANKNMAWKDTSLVLPGEYIDILVDMSNLGEWMAHCHISEHLHAGMMMQFRVQDASGYATGDEFRETVSAEEETHRAEVSVRKSTQEFTFTSKVVPSNYSVVAESTRFKAGVEQAITLTLFDAELNGVVLSEKYPNPLGITFVKNDDQQNFYTYPGNTTFEAVDHGGAGHDNSDGHHDVAPASEHDNSDGHHGFNFIQTVYAHGGDEDGHADAVGRVYQYTVPVLFPSKGFYRAFVEFVPEGMNEPVVLTVDVEVISSSFSIDNLGWSVEQKWWILLIVSLILMVPLVAGVRKYINEK